MSVSQESSIEQEQHFECSVMGIWRQMKNSLNTRMCNEYTEVPTSPDNRRGLTGSRVLEGVNELTVELSPA